MPKVRRDASYRTPTRQEQNKIWFTGYKLSELFTDEEIAELAVLARDRIVGEFHYAMEQNPRFQPGSGKRPLRRTDNYIIGLSGRPSSLARYVRDSMHRPFISQTQLPDELLQLKPKLVNAVIQQVQYEVLILVIQLMHNREIWYDEGLGIWQISQTNIDQYLELKHSVRALRKNDMRPYHGRVRSQSKRRGIPEGTSIGIA